MTRTIYMFKILPLLLLPLIYACSSSSVYEKVYPTLSDNKYDSEFPYSSCSQQLEEISRTIKLITSLGYYTSYVFNEEMKIMASDIKTIDLKTRAAKIINYNSVSSGTATIIHSQGRSIALLTCAHIVNFPDTIVTYFNLEDGSLSLFIQSISVKVGQSNYVPDIPERGYVDILAMDVKNDIAVIGKTLSTVTANINTPVFAYPIGKARELEWGDFVYVFGYPLNYKMISKALVSNPDHDKGNSFLIDAVFNRGFSGGLVLAIRDGVPHFELVGLVRSVPAENEFVLKPILKNPDAELNPQLPYKGEFTIEKRQAIKFGITKVIGIETILEFFKTNKDLLERQGFFIPKFTD
jgi:hypothetical protein